MIVGKRYRHMALNGVIYTPVYIHDDTCALVQIELTERYCPDEEAEAYKSIHRDGWKYYVELEATQTTQIYAEKDNGKAI